MPTLARAGIGALVFAIFIGSAPMGAETQPESLTKPVEASQDWLTNLGDPQGHRFSTLAQIDRSNVNRLVVRYSVVLGGLIDAAGNYDAALPVSPLVKDGFLYIVDGWGAVSKLDMSQQGKIIWRSDAGQYNLDAWLQASRGLAFYDNSILSIAADGKLNWIDDETGKVTRSVQVGDPVEGYTIAAPPLVVGDIVVVGSGGADRGARAQIDAIDGRTGQRLWQRRPGPDDQWTGAFLQTGVYDQVTRTTIWGTSRSAVGIAEGEADKAGGNAVVAFDISTGATRGVYTYADKDARSLAESGTYQLIPDPESSGTVLAHFGNDGQFYVLDANGLNARLVDPYIPLEWQPRGTGAILQQADASNGQASGPFIWPRGCPNVQSADAFASAYSPRTQLSYGAGADACHPDAKPIITASAPGWLGAYYSGADSQLGLLSAVSPANRPGIRPAYLQLSAPFRCAGDRGPTGVHLDRRWRVLRAERRNAADGLDISFCNPDTEPTDYLPGWWRAVHCRRGWGEWLR